MIKLNKPTNLNGTELLNELAANGVACDKPPFIDGDGDLWLDVKSANQAKAAAVVAAHNGTTLAPDPTIEDKLASVGLNLTDLKTALGI
jgi:Ser/Thr protein kinase RdoA (MazF antagonist)